MTFHFIGIGGIGMSALARILLDQKIAVSGSDLSANATTRGLAERGALIKVGHASENISPEATVVYSSGIKKDNPEYLAAQAQKCRLIHRSELLAELMQERLTLAVAGTHGKTTTSALLTHVLMKIGLDPSFAIGGLLADLTSLNGKLGKGPYFIAEADESDGSFVNYHPFGAIVTNLDWDHREHFQTESRLHEAFKQFMSQVTSKEHLFYWGDDPALSYLAPRGSLSYGWGEECDWRISEIRQEKWKTFFTLSHQGKTFRDLCVSLPGRHQALNAAAVFALAWTLQNDEEAIRSALASFPGVQRRCQKRGEEREVLILDDYAHHPNEVEVTLQGIREAIGERRLLALFQPHRYSRLRDHLSEFARAFDWVDHVFVTDVFSAGEEPISGVTAERLVAEVEAQSTVPVSYLPRERCSSHLQTLLRPHDVLITLGAGDVTHIGGEVLDCLKQTPPPKLRVGLLFGGRSVEHEISVRSGRFVAGSLDPELYEIAYFGIDQQGKWIVGEEAKALLEKGGSVSSETACSLLSPEVGNALERCDLFLPILHGPNGEDGTIQGFFEMLGKPYVGPDCRAAAICMDKVLTKRLVKDAGVPTPEYCTLSHWEWLRSSAELLKQIDTRLSFPLFVKPTHVGSSLGITKVEERDTLEEAIAHAFRYDTHILVEEGKVGCRELEFAVMGNHMAAVPMPGEKYSGGEFVDYEKKYGKNAVKTTLTPELTSEQLQMGREYAKRAYEAVGNSGMTRVDFLMDSEGHFWFFEMNPIPGMQKLSLFPKIWEREGISPRQLLDRLIILALERTRGKCRHFI